MHWQKSRWQLSLILIDPGSVITAELIYNPAIGTEAQLLPTVCHVYVKVAILVDSFLRFIMGFLPSYICFYMFKACFNKKMHDNIFSAESSVNP